MKGDDELYSLIRDFPSLEVNDHLEVEVDTLGHKLLDTDNHDIVKAGREGAWWPGPALSAGSR